MVDLVKIRKKAKKKSEESAAAESPSPAVGPEAATQSADTGREQTSSSAPAAEPLGGGTSSPAPHAEAPATAAQTADRTQTAPGADSKLDRFRAQAGRLRDAVADEGGADLSLEEGQIEVLSFVIAGEHYAADIERIIEIVTPRAVTRVPNADPTIVGIVSLRGMMVTLVDIRSRLRHKANEPTADTRIIVVDEKGETIGFEVDRVLRVLKIDRSAVEPHPVVHASELDESILGVFRHEGALTILLDFDKLLAAPGARL